MALIECKFRSNVLQLEMAMNVILPDPAELPAGRRLPTLYLLHGLSDDHTIWQRRTSIERYVDGRNLAVVMPEVGRSFYSDMAHGLRYWTFISQELPAVARAYFPLSEKREDNFVAGLSMGGYGAFKLGLNLPEHFAAAASLSGALDILAPLDVPDPDWRQEMVNIFGDPDKVKGSDRDLFWLAEQLGASKWKDMPFYQWCGSEDFLYEDNLRFREQARKCKLNLTYEEGPGDHSWGYWDTLIQRVLDWLPLKK
ncbi:MAG TPA: alpha/beta hydrolase family protein [Anaerolineaceae bacterium]|nr:alpha/beta hydrolase family protein [Anaerolineaceae bacterium]